MVRLLALRGRDVFCFPRDCVGKLDLPTRAVPRLDDGRTTARRLALDLLGTPAAVSLVGYVRNVVEQADAGYPWPTPFAHFSVWAASGDPHADGIWLDLDDRDSPLRARHWWPLLSND